MRWNTPCCIALPLYRSDPGVNRQSGEWRPNGSGLGRYTGRPRGASQYRLHLWPLSTQLFHTTRRVADNYRDKRTSTPSVLSAADLSPVTSVATSVTVKCATLYRYLHASVGTLCQRHSLCYIHVHDDDDDSDAVLKLAEVETVNSSTVYFVA